MNEIIIDDDHGLLRLRTMSADIHWPELQVIGNTPEISQMMASVAYPWTEQAVKLWISDGQFRGKLGYRLGIFDAENNLVGAVGINGPTPSFSIFVTKNVARSGVGSAACRMAMRDAVSRFSLEQFYCDVFSDNLTSQRFVQRLGFERISEIPGRSVAREGEHLVFRYCVSKEKILDGDLT